MWCTKPLWLIALMSIGVFVQAQQAMPRFLESQLVVSHKLSDTYNANLAFSSRMEYEDANSFLPTRFVQLSHFSTFRMGNNSHFGLGLMYRFAEDFDVKSPNEFRLTQQFHTATKPNVVRYAHRFRVEERFVGAETFMRLRYSMGIDFPLNGQALDVKEAYTLYNAESLLQLNSNVSPRFDFRISGGVGVLVTPKTKLQATFQYRFEQLTQNQTGRWFLLLGGYIKI
jgi:hypothetical protein